MSVSRRFFCTFALVLLSLAGGVAAAQSFELPERGTFMGVGEANGMTVQIFRDERSLLSVFSQVNGDRSQARLQVIEPNLASGVLQIGSAVVVMTIETVEENRIAIGTVPLDGEGELILSAARGFEFVRQ
jgi:hypothetical protein